MALLDLLTERASIGRTLLALVALYTAYVLIGRATRSYKIRKLGGNAPLVKSYLPFGLDFIYDAIAYSRRHENMQFWDKYFMEFGNHNSPYTIEVMPLGKRVIITCEPENIKAILATQFSDYGKGENFNRDFKAFLGNSIFSTDGEIWHDSRQLIRPQFIKDRVSDLETFDHHLSILLPKLGTSGTVVDLRDLFFKYTLDAATDFLLGHSAGSLEGGGGDFAHAFAEVQRIQNGIARAGALKSLLIDYKLFNKHLKTMNNFVEPFIDRTLALSQAELESKSKGDSGYTFLHALAAYTRDRTVLRDQLVAVLLAGRDTTACTLSWTFYELANDPKTVAALRKEIEEVVGLERAPTYADLKSMKLLQNVMNETLRLYPVVPFNVREALKDTTLPRGGGLDGMSPIGVLKGTPIAYSPHLMQLREDIYPRESADFPDPLKWVPQRWFTWQPKPWTYIPFNGGPRLCVGQQFALTEMGYTIVRIFQRFKRVELRMPNPVLPPADPEDPSHPLKFNQGAGTVRGLRGVGTSSVKRITSSRVLKYKSEIVLVPEQPVQVAFFEE